MVHLMSAGRLRYLFPAEKGPKTPVFQTRFADGGRLVLTEAGSKKRAGVWLLRPDALEAELAHLGPEADTITRRHLRRFWRATLAGSIRYCATSARSPESAAPGRTRS